MSVAEAQAKITSSEFSEWRAIYNLEPFGDYRADLRTGILAAATYNVWAGKGDELADPFDFMPDFSANLRSSPAPADDDQAAELEAEREFVSAMGARKVEKIR